MTANATIADAAATCAAGGKTICDDRLPVRKLMQMPGKRLLPRLGVSATISPFPQTAEPWMSPDSGNQVSAISNQAPVYGFDSNHPMGSIIALQQSIVNLAHWSAVNLTPTSQSEMLQLSSRGFARPGVITRACALVSYWRCLTRITRLLRLLAANARLVRPRGASRRRAPPRARIGCGNTPKRCRPDAAARVKFPPRRWRRRATRRCGRSAAPSTVGGR